MNKIQTVLQMNSDPNAPKVSLKQQPFATPDKLHDVIVENYKDIRKKLPLVNHKMSLYLSNKDIESIILKRVKVNAQNLVHFYLRNLILQKTIVNERIICNKFIWKCLK